MATSVHFQSFEMAGPLSGGDRCVFHSSTQSKRPAVLFKRAERAKRSQRFSHRLAACRQSWE